MEKKGWIKGLLQRIFWAFFFFFPLFMGKKQISFFFWSETKYMYGKKQYIKALQNKCPKVHNKYMDILSFFNKANEDRRDGLVSNIWGEY